jgi:hypothetical protein
MTHSNPAIGQYSFGPQNEAYDCLYTLAQDPGPAWQGTVRIAEK